jgi:NhaP-type Na+/H+ or K+/H+ antiporter
MAEVASGTGAAVADATGDASTRPVAPPPPPSSPGRRRRVVTALLSFYRRVRPPNASVTVTPALILLILLVFGVLFFAAPDVFVPGSPYFATYLIWVIALIAGEAARWLRLPRVIGMLLAGPLLANAGGGAAIAGFPRKWGVQMRAAALATIFLRCGLELEFATMRMYKWPALRLALVPGLAEALFDAGLAVAIFGMPPTLALALGFILKAVGPGLVVPAMFQLQSLGLGADKGIPSTIVIAASFDDVVAITGFSIFINLAITGQDNAAWQMASGPLQVVFGIVAGGLLGTLLGCTRVWRTSAKRFVGTYGSALFVMFLLERYTMLSGGALGSLTVGLAACLAWEAGKPRALSLGPSLEHSADVERVLARVWDLAAEPMLFATIGATFRFDSLPSGTVGKSVLIVVCGVALRVLVTFFTMMGGGYSVRERVFFSVAWTPKATVQAALGAVPLTLVMELKKGAEDYSQWLAWGDAALCTSLMAIVICGTLGTLAAYLSASRLLQPSSKGGDGGEERGAVGAAGAAAPGGAVAEAGADDSGKLVPPAAGMGPSTVELRHRSLSHASLSAYHRRARSGNLEAAATAVGGDFSSAAGSSAAGVTALETRPATSSARERERGLVDAYFDSIDALIGLLEGRGGGGGGGGVVEIDRSAAAAAASRTRMLERAIQETVGPRTLTVRQMLHVAATERGASTSTRGDVEAGGGEGGGARGARGAAPALESIASVTQSQPPPPQM